VLQTVRKETEKTWLYAAKFSSVWHTGLSGGAPDSVRCARLVSGENVALGIRRRRTAIIHRMVQWCTGLSGESSAANSSPSRKAKGRRGYNSPDCSVSQWSAAQSSRDMWTAPTVSWCIGQSDVHRTMSGAPISSEDQRSDALEKEGDRAPDSYSDGPVVHRTVRCTTRQKASVAFHVGLQWLLAALGL
jgi:hypothetical protein